MKIRNLTALGLAALAMLPASCQLEERGANVTGEVEFTLTAAVPGQVQTYGSGDGGAKNVDKNTYDQRYILEVYDGENVAYRGVKTVEVGEAASFQVRLLAKQYTFAFWADFVENGSTTDKFYNTSSGLDEVVVKEARPAGKEEADAYCHSEIVDLREVGLSKQFPLKRPFGKIRLVSTDDPANAGFTAPGNVTVTYAEGLTVPNQFNVLTGEASGETLAAESYSYDPQQETVTVGGQTYPDAYILGVDYILYSKANTNYTFDVQVEGCGARTVTNIPVSANKLTTVIGNFYTNEGNLTVVVDDEFDGNQVKYLEVEPGDLQTVLTGLSGAGVREADIALTGSVTGQTYTLPAMAENSTLRIQLNGASGPVVFDGGESFTGLLSVSNVGTGVDLTINVPNGDAEIASGSWSGISVTTKDNTCIVNEDAAVETLTVLAGNVKIYGRVMRVERGESYEGTVTYNIATPAQFRKFAANVNAGMSCAGETVVLENDIDLAQEPWVPVGKDRTVPFKGVFDGNGKTVRGLKIENRPAAEAGGLFGVLYGTVKNVSVSGSAVKHQVDGRNGGVAVVAGLLYTQGVIENVVVEDAAVESNRWTGGIAGYMYGTIRNCQVEDVDFKVSPDRLSGNYDNGDKVGGIVGYLVKDGAVGLVEECVVRNVTVQGYRDLGGIVGCANSTAGQEVTVRNCEVSGVELIQDFTNGYKEKAADIATLGTVYGRGYLSEESTGNAGEVAITVKVQDTKTAQLALDAAVSPRTIELAAGEYEQLHIRQSQPATEIVDPSGHPDYKRTIRNLVVQAAEEQAVSVAGFKLAAGHVYTNSYNAVTDKPVMDGTNAFYSYFDIQELTVSGFRLTSSFYVGSDSNTETTPFLLLNGLHIDRCSLQGEDKMLNNDSNRLVRIGNGSKRLENVTVQNCSVADAFQGVMAYGTVDITVAGCTFEDLGHNVYQTGTGKSVFERNTIRRCSSDRLFRQTSSSFLAGDWIKILDNAVFESDGDATDPTYPYYKTAATGIDLVFTGNTMDGKSWTEINKKPE